MRQERQNPRILAGGGLGQTTRNFLTFVNTTGSAYAAKTRCIRPAAKYPSEKWVDFGGSFNQGKKHNKAAGKR